MQARERREFEKLTLRKHRIYLADFEPGDELHKAAKVELEIRKLEAAERRHWSLEWGFLVAVLTLLLAAISAWPQIEKWIPAGKVWLPAKAPQSQSVPATPALPSQP